jgi:hypothetical protein
MFLVNWITNKVQLLLNHDSELVDDAVISNVFVSQAGSWDCGIACTSMALRWCAVNLNSIDTTPMCVSRHTPLWTIDMYCFLRQRGINCEFSTQVPGVNAQHASLEWYTPHIDADRQRVEAQFQLAVNNGWVVKPSLSTMDLIRTLHENSKESASGIVPLSQRTLCAIVLVDSNYLYADLRSGGSGRCSTTNYSGHYVIVLAINDSSANDDTDKISGGDVLYMDPARAPRIQRCSVELFDKGRCSSGTDMDVLLLWR